MVYTCSRCHNTAMHLLKVDGQEVCKDCFEEILLGETTDTKELHERLLKAEACIVTLISSVDALNRNLDKLKNDIRKFMSKNGGKK